MDCVKDMRCAGQMDVLVNEGINHTLEHKAESRVFTGKLFSKLVQEKVLTPEKFKQG